jgi:predicted  nucleic acid-binding Zn-ribbon protein
MAALGKPAISTPRGLELRALQGAIDNTRQRIEAIERELARVAGQAGQTAFSGGGGSSASITALTAALASLRLDLASLTTRVETLEAAAPSAADNVLYDHTGRALLSSTGGALLVGP